MRDKVIDRCQSSFANVFWVILPAGLACSINQGQPQQPAGTCHALHGGKGLVWGVKIPGEHWDFVTGEFYGGPVRLLGMGVQNHRVTELIRLEKTSEMTKSSL